MPPKRKRRAVKATDDTASQTIRVSENDADPTQEIAESSKGIDVRKSTDQELNNPAELDGDESSPGGKTSLSEIAEPEESPLGSKKPSLSTEYLYTRAYVDQHKDTENFHHRGKGKRAKGLPKEGSHYAVAVQGPDAEAWKKTTSEAYQSGKK